VIVRKRGIVLIGILVLTLLATFFVGALLQMNPTRLRRTTQDERHDLAAAAARAGLEYALAQLAEDPEWKALANTTTVQTDAMVVREDSGNVLGWVRSDNGEWAGFRLRFNYQDGPGGPDGLDQPAQMIASQAISYNNLGGSTAVPLPLGTGPDYSYTTDTGFNVPENSVALVVEGVVGPDVSPDGAGLTSPPDSKQGTQGQTVTRTLEGIYQVTGFSEGLPDGAVLQAGGDSSFLLGAGPPASVVPSDDDFRGYLRLMASDQTAIMRTKGASSIANGAGKSSPYNFYPDMHSEVRVGRPGFSPITKQGQEFTSGSEAANSVLMDIEWEKVARSDQEDRLRLPAGVYAVSGGDTDSESSDRVKYFPMTFAEYRSALVRGEKPVSAPVPEGFLKAVELNGRDWTDPDGVKEKRDLITFDRDVEVTTVDDNKDIAIIPVGGAKQKSRTTQTATVPPSEFEALPPAIQTETGQAILDYIKSETSSSELSFSIDGRQFTYDSSGNLTGDGNFDDVAKAVMNGTPITFEGGILPTNLFPGTEPVTFGGGGTSGTTKTGGGYAGGTAGATSGEVLVQFADQQTHVDGGSGGYVSGWNGGSGGTGGGGASGSFTVSDPNAFLGAVQTQTEDVPDEVTQTNVDPLQVPATATDDQTVPQDLEIHFAPSNGDSAAIRTDGNVLLATHISGQGGAVVAGGRIDIIGLGIDLHAGQGERDGVSLYSKKDINISTYDQKRNKFWDASVKGVIFSRGNLTIRMGETVGPDGTPEPAWGSFDFLGSAIVLGQAPAFIGGGRIDSGSGGGKGETHQTSMGDFQIGNAAMIARGIRLFYEPKFLAPYVESDRMIPIFGAVSVAER
jgi:hypothetical protein